MDTKKLRQKILDLAIRGKLVPQDPNDEPASVLLERIRAEKEQLIKEGKIKRTKKSNASDTSHYENVPFEVPEGWVWCRLEDIAYVAAGSTPSKESFVENGVPYIKMYNLRNQKIDFEFHPQYITEEVHNNKLARSRTQPGDLLMNIVGPPLGKLAIIPESLPEANFNQAAVLIRPFKFKPAITQYLFYYLSELSEINSISTKGSAGQVNISLTQSQQMRIALPPLAELERITQKIESLLSKIGVLETSIDNIYDHISKIKSGILEKALSGKLVSQDKTDEPAITLLKSINPDFDPTDNRHYENIQINIPNTWCWGKVGDLFEHNTGKALNSSNTNGSMLNYITTSNLYWDRFDLTIVKQMRFTDSEIEKCKATKGDLLLCEGGDVGRAAIWNYDFDIMIQNHIHRLRGKVDVSSRFFFYVFMLYKQKNYIGGKGVAIQGLSSRDLHNLPIPIPPLKEQYRIADTLDNLIAKMDKITAEL